MLNGNVDSQQTSVSFFQSIPVYLFLEFHSSVALRMAEKIAEMHVDLFCNFCLKKIEIQIISQT